MTKLLISLPLSEAAQRFYGSTAPTYNKTGDAGIDLPFVSDVKPYDAEVTETIGVISFETVFAMYDSLYPAMIDSLLNIVGTDENLDYLSYYLKDRPETVFPCKFYIVPRSSISKTPFRLANCEGIIDAGYRGIEIVTEYSFETDCNVEYWTGDTLGCYLDYHPQLGIKGRKSRIDAGDRLLQVVAPSLDSILWVRLDFTEENCQFWSEVIGNKNRGGFGTTNANG
jgi:dUTPase